MTSKPLRMMILVVAGCVVILLAMLGQDLFLALPLVVLRGIRFPLFIVPATYICYRLLPFRKGDAVPLTEDSLPASPWWLAWVGPAAVAILAFPMLGQPGNLGFGDWDLFLGKCEAARRSIVDYGQFPWWDPWTRGGFPLAANPQCGVSGVAMPFALAFGTSIGMRLGTLVCFVLAIEGTRRLTHQWLGDPYAATLAGLIYGLNGAVLVAAVAAYHVSMCYPVLPWMLYLIGKLEKRPSAGVWLGFWAAFNVLNGIQYFTVYILLIAGVAWVRTFQSIDRPSRWRLLSHTLIAIGTCLALSGWRLATTGVVCLDYPRALWTGWNETPRQVMGHLLNRPTAETLNDLSEIPYFWEATCYLGPLVLLLAGISLGRGWRWWHTLTLFCGVLAVGSTVWYHPSYWLAKLPVFSTMHVVTRWRFMAVLGLAMGAASTFSTWRKDARPSRRWIAYVAALVIVADYLSFGIEVLPVAFSIDPVEVAVPGPPLPVGEVLQAKKYPGFPAISRGYGVINGFEPLMGYDRDISTERKFPGKLGYLGEHWTDRGPATVISWSPNRIELQVGRREQVFINQNPGSYWWVNGRQTFEGMRCAELQKVFVVEADERGRVLLEIRPRGLALGWGMHLGGLILVGLMLVAHRILDSNRRIGRSSLPSGLASLA